MNSGWEILMGPLARDPQGEDTGDLVDLLPGSTYSDPEFSFAQPIGIAALGFLAGSALGAAWEDALLVGDNNTQDLRVFRLDAARSGFLLAGGLADRVADGAVERDLTLLGRDFGIVTDIQIGPDGAVYVLALLETTIGPGGATQFLPGSLRRIALVPEPGSGAALAVGLLGLAALRRRRAGP
jgi:hypothetical protein